MEPLQPLVVSSEPASRRANFWEGVSFLPFRDARSSHALEQHKEDTEGHKIARLDMENQPTKTGLTVPVAGIAPGGGGTAPGWEATGIALCLDGQCCSWRRRGRVLLAIDSRLN